ncbi:hypothetical protein PRIPAC_73336 [Pristionchus pacificus]|uniref:Uncharacterized protein n=1 Tax=Pristionchus pacificus TaxID=54126 RepID=A0A2A6BZV9_PRIPA|nr:hypothetical protein PRIPAC_73336 [Pristionchus pacificus]|eukprot:PDM71420.1 hypothetical protein PRIPAC_37827 [Pristionchus pacificus]
MGCFLNRFMRKRDDCYLIGIRRKKKKKGMHEKNLLTSSPLQSQPSCASRIAISAVEKEMMAASEVHFWNFFPQENTMPSSGNLSAWLRTILFIFKRLMNEIAKSLKLMIIAKS